jgi:hypothetical protein
MMIKLYRIGVTFLFISITLFSTAAFAERDPSALVLVEGPSPGVSLDQQRL